MILHIFWIFADNNDSTYPNPSHEEHKNSGGYNHEQQKPELPEQQQQ